MYRRLLADNRLIDDPSRESNVDFLLPYDHVLAMWRRVFTAAYTPHAVYRRFAYQIANVFPNRIKPPNGKARVNAANIGMGLRLMLNASSGSESLRIIGECSGKMALPLLRKGDIESVLHVCVRELPFDKIRPQGRRR